MQMKQEPHTIIHTDFDLFYKTFSEISSDGNIENALNAIKQLENDIFIQLNPDDDFIFLNYSIVSSIQQFELEIPSCITKIDNVFCQQVSNLVSLKIPASVSSIGDHAFVGCQNLEHIQFSDGLIEIGQNAFSQCIKLADVSFPSSLQKIDNLAFSDCIGLSNIEMYANLQVGINAFEYTRDKNFYSFKVKTSS